MTAWPHSRSRSWPAEAATALALALLWGCTGNPSPIPDGGTVMDLASAFTRPVIPPSLFAGLKTGAAAHDELCANDNLHPDFPNDADLFIKVFCADLKPGVQVPTPHSLLELESLLGLSFKDANGTNGGGGNPGYALLGHSSSSVGRFVSAINPRAVLFTPPPAGASKPTGYVLLAYSRGDTFVEVAAHDPTLDKVVLYLVVFQTACAAAGCTPADLLTPAVESGWLGITAYTAAAEINNTILDCLQCHQPSGTTGPTILRLQESSAPFTHLFSATTAGGRALLADFHAAHGTGEAYAGIPAPMIDKSDPALLSQLIGAAGFAAQPNAFASAAIEAEVTASAPSQPAVNVPIGSSATWNAIHAQAVAGQAIAVPYHDVKVTDPAKLGAASAAYQRVQSGQSPAGSLPDIRDVLLDDGMRDMGFAPAAGLNGQALLVQLCQQCHNNQLDQSITRALFNIERLAQLPAVRKATAIARLNVLDTNDLTMMPPPLFRAISKEERMLMIDALSH